MLPYLAVVGLALGWAVASGRKAKGASKARQQFLDAVRAELGKSDPVPYYESALGYVPDEEMEWCGIFTLAMLHRIGLALDWKWILGEGFLFRLPTTTTPKPADLYYMDERRHHGVIEEIRPDGMIVTLDGNSTNGEVARNVRDPSEIRAFFSIAPLLKAA